MLLKKFYCDSNCKSFCNKQFCIITFFCVSYSLTGKWNFDIDFFQVSTYYNFSNVGLIKKCNEDI